MLDSSCKYYLETNALYGLANNIKQIAYIKNVATSLYAIDELVSGIIESNPEKQEKNFQRRKSIVKKVFDYKLLIYPYLPIECIALSFGLDISNIPVICTMKSKLWDQAKTIVVSESYVDYIEQMAHLSINIKEENNAIAVQEKNEINALYDTIKDDYKRIFSSEKPPNSAYEIDINDLIIDLDSKPDLTHEKKVLVDILNVLNISYTDEETSEALGKYDSRQLTAFQLGLILYSLKRSSLGQMPQKNDILDLKHLLYIRDENHVLVSNDTIFTRKYVETDFNSLPVSLPQQIISINNFKLQLL